MLTGTTPLLSYCHKIPEKYVINDHEAGSSYTMTKPDFMPPTEQEDIWRKKGWTYWSHQDIVTWRLAIFSSPQQSNCFIMPVATAWKHSIHSVSFGCVRISCLFFTLHIVAFVAFILVVRYAQQFFDSVSNIRVVFVVEAVCRWWSFGLATPLSHTAWHSKMH